MSIAFNPADPAPGIYRGIPADLYHQTAAVSSSLLKAIHCDSPAHAKFLMGEPDGRTSRAMEFGDKIHACLLENSRFAAEYVVAGRCAATTKKDEPCTRNGTRRLCIRADGAREQWFCEQHARYYAAGASDTTPQNIITSDERDRLDAIRKAVWAHPHARLLLKSAVEVELTLIWIDPATGLKCKARPDLLVQGKGGMILADLKSASCAKPPVFCKQAASLGYPVQLVHYLNGMAACGLSRPPLELVDSDDLPWVIAAHSAPPHIVEAFEVSFHKCISPAVDFTAAALATFAECSSSGAWPSYTRAGEIPQLEYPDYFLREPVREQMNRSHAA